MNKPSYHELEKRIRELEDEYLQPEGIEAELVQKQLILREQNINLVRKSIELSDVMRDLEDKNYDLELSRADLEKTLVALRESEEKLSGIVDSIKDHMSMMDEQHNIVWANDIAEELFGPDLVGKKCYTAYHGRQKPCKPCVVKTCFEDGKVHEHETKVIGADGNPMIFWCIASVAAWHTDGRPKMVVEISRNITERKRAAEALQKAHDELEQRVEERTASLASTTKELELELTERKRAEAQKEALMKELEMSNEKLKQSNQQLQDFVYIASHDLREPLRKISAFGRIFADSLKGKLDEDQQENLGFMIDGANRMQQMTDALLTYSRVTTKAKPHQRVDLNEVICDLRDLELASQLEETDGTIEVPQSLPAVFADSTQMHQLLQNLIGNGLKYHKKDSAPKVIVRANLMNDGMVKVEVEDDGIGIEKDHFGEVFTMFRRLHSRSEYQGTGIGLAVCKRIVERHGGEIGVESVPGAGSTFLFTIPAARVQGNNKKEVGVNE